MQNATVLNFSNKIIIYKTCQNNQQSTDEQSKIDQQSGHNKANKRNHASHPATITSTLQIVCVQSDHWPVTDLTADHLHIGHTVSKRNCLWHQSQHWFTVIRQMPQKLESKATHTTSYSYPSCQQNADIRFLHNNFKNLMLRHWLKLNEHQKMSWLNKNKFAQ